MNAEEEEATVIALWYLVQLSDDSPNREMWVHPINEKRNLKPFIAELRADPEKFYNYCRMKPTTFDPLSYPLLYSWWRSPRMRRTICPKPFARKTKIDKAAQSAVRRRFALPCRARCSVRHLYSNQYKPCRIRRLKAKRRAVPYPVCGRPNMNNIWTENKSQLNVITLRAMLMLKYNVGLTCDKFHDKIKAEPALLKDIHSSKKYANE